MSEENKTVELKEEDLEKVSGGSVDNNNSFNGLAVGDIYQSKEDSSKYAKIILINKNNNGRITFYRGTRQGDYIMQSDSTEKVTPYLFRQWFNTDVKFTLEWRKGLIN